MSWPHRSGPPYRLRDRSTTLFETIMLYEDMYDCPFDMSQKWLARITGIQPCNVTSALKHMEKEGFIVRKFRYTDRSMYRLGEPWYLTMTTRKGRREYEKEARNKWAIPKKELKKLIETIPLPGC